MPTPTPRPSLLIDLLQRYETQPEGGAFSAKLAGTSTIEPSILAQQFDNTTLFVIDEPFEVSNFKGTAGSTYTEISSLSQGLDTTRYGSVSHP